MKKLLLVIAAVAIIAGVGGYWILIKNNIAQADGRPYINIPTGSDVKAVMSLLSERHILQDMSTFEIAAQIKGYKAVKPGHYVFNKSMGNREILNMLASGRQTPVKLVIYNIRTKEDMAGLVGRTLEIDSVSFLAKLSDPAFCAQFDLDTDNILCHFMADNYELKWNTDIDGLIQKMDDSYRRYWTAERLDTCGMKGLKPAQALILASIVEKECIFDKELPTVAGVYFNRLHSDMPLQADPTLVFATRDFNARRVTDYHKTFESPYNTYLHSGLPPGPICIPKRKSIEAVLNAEQNDYLYFCANPDMSGYSVFSTTLAEQNKIAVEYRKKLKELKVK